MDNRARQNPESLRQAIEQLEQQLRRINHSHSERMALATGRAAPGETSRVLPFPQRREHPLGEGAGNAVRMDDLDRPTEEAFCYAVASRALRSRRQLLAREIDRTCGSLGGQARILRVGCGHPREADLCRSLRDGHFREFVALDTQLQPPPTVDSCRAVQCSLDELFHGRTDLCHFDLIYCAGLYEALDDQDARDLTRNLFARLLPGGRLLLSSFLPGMPDTACPAGPPDWRPHQRGDAALLDLLLGVAYNDIGGARVFHDLDNCVAFLEVTRYG